MNLEFRQVSAAGSGGSCIRNYCWAHPCRVLGQCGTATILASADAPSTATAFDAATGEVLATVEHGGEGVMVQFAGESARYHFQGLEEAIRHVDSILGGKLASRQSQAEMLSLIVEQSNSLCRAAGDAAAQDSRTTILPEEANNPTSDSVAVTTVGQPRADSVAWRHHETFDRGGTISGSVVWDDGRRCWAWNVYWGANDLHFSESASGTTGDSRCAIKEARDKIRTCREEFRRQGQRWVHAIRVTRRTSFTRSAQRVDGRR